MILPLERWAAPQPPTRLSVIIPARDEERRIGAVLRQVRRADPWEIIVVDGRSADRTREIAAAHGATVISSRPGRGRQQRAGAVAATGDALVFLHADTIPPRDFVRHVLRILARPGVSGGAFRLRIGAPHRSLRLIEKVVNWRSRALRRPYGDQAVFVTAAMLRRAGSFPGLPVMEDLELVRRLRRLGRIEIAPACVVTSARRWIECGIWRTTLLNQACIIAYRLGVRPARIARWRQRRRRTEAPVLALGPRGPGPDLTTEGHGEREVSVTAETQRVRNPYNCKHWRRSSLSVLAEGRTERSKRSSRRSGRFESAAERQGASVGPEGRTERSN